MRNGAAPRQPAPPRRARRWLGRVVLLVLVLAALAAVSLMMPVPSWRTGRAPVPPLPLTRGGPALPLPARIWIDSDAACGAGARTDADDCLALLALLGARQVTIAGIGSVAGNAPLPVTHRTIRALLDRLPHDVPAPPLYRGGPAAGAGLTPAAAALRRALAAGPLTVVALGPLTNVAAALDGRRDLAAHLTRLVAVMGRRPGHLFHPSEGNGAGGWLGHGPVFSDFNVREDPRAAEAVLALPVPVTLVPYDAARTVVIDAADLNRLALHGGAAAWVAASSRGWLAFWADRVGTSGFRPFDLLAAAYVLAPRYFHCARASSWVVPTSGLAAWLQGPAAVLVGLPTERPPGVRTARRLDYCPQVDAGVHDVLMRRLLEG